MLAIERLSRVEKLEFMESLWEDLLLADAERALASGEAKFADWEVAKKVLRERAGCPAL